MDRAVSAVLVGLASFWLLQRGGPLWEASAPRPAIIEIAAAEFNASALAEVRLPAVVRGYGRLGLAWEPADLLRHLATIPLSRPRTRTSDGTFLYGEADAEGQGPDPELIDARSFMTHMQGGNGSWSYFKRSVNGWPSLRGELRGLQRLAVRERGAESAAGPPPSANLWLGSAGSAASLHYDHDHNLVVQLAGRKHWRLLPPAVGARLPLHSSLGASWRQALRVRGTAAAERVMRG
jgi:hypothetical protein